MFGNKNKQKSFIPVEGQVEEIENIYEILPPDGTIIGMATEEEMNTAAEIQIKHNSLLRLQDSNLQFSGTSYKEYLKDIEDFERYACEFYRGIHKRLSIPWEWTIGIDVANGPIYVVDNNIIVEEEE
jgi:hypothetical protein